MSSKFDKNGHDQLSSIVKMKLKQNSRETSNLFVSYVSEQNYQNTNPSHRITLQQSYYPIPPINPITTCQHKQNLENYIHVHILLFVKKSLKCKK